MRTLDHPNVLKIFEFYSDKNSYSIVTEIKTGGELFQEIVDKGPFNEMKITQHMSCSKFYPWLIIAIIWKLFTWDLKPENILSR